MLPRFELVDVTLVFEPDFVLEDSTMLFTPFSGLALTDFTLFFKPLSDFAPKGCTLPFKPPSGCEADCEVLIVDPLLKESAFEFGGDIEGEFNFEPPL